MTYHDICVTSDDYVEALRHARMVADNITKTIGVEVFPYRWVDLEKNFSFVLRVWEKIGISYCASPGGFCECLLRSRVLYWIIQEKNNEEQRRTTQRWRNPEFYPLFPAMRAKGQDVVQKKLYRERVPSFATSGSFTDDYWSVCLCESICWNFAELCLWAWLSWLKLLCLRTCLFQLFLRVLWAILGHA